MISLAQTFQTSPEPDGKEAQCHRISNVKAAEPTESPITEEQGRDGLSTEGSLQRDRYEI